MKNFILLIILTVIASIANCQSSSDYSIKLQSCGETVLFASPDSVTIDGPFPIKMTHINYYTIQYDPISELYFVDVGYISKDGCGFFNQELSLWISSKTDDVYHFIYTDYCERFTIWRGDESLSSKFHLESRYEALKEKQYDSIKR